MIIKCCIMELPSGIYGASFPDNDDWCILLASNVADITRRHAFGHEMAHVLLGRHQQTDRPLVEIEREANAQAWEYYRRYRKQYSPQGQYTIDA